MKKRLISLMLLIICSDPIAHAQPSKSVTSADNPRLIVQKAHNGSMTSVVFSPDGTYLLTGGPDGIAVLWDVETGLVVRRFIGHALQINAAAFAPDGQYVLTGSSDGTARLWSMKTGDEIHRFDGGAVMSVAFSPNGKFAVIGSGWNENRLRLLTIEERKEVQHLEGHYTNALVFMPDGHRVLFVNTEGAVILWSLDKNEEAQRIEAKTSPMSPIAVSGDARYVLTRSAHQPSTVIMWLLETGEEVQRFDGHTGKVHTVAFSPDGKKVLTGSYASVRLWSVKTGQQLMRYKEENGIYDANFSPDGESVLIGSNDSAIMRSIETGKEIRRFQGQTKWVNDIVFSPDGQYLLMGGSDSRLWSLSSGKQLRRFKGPLLGRGAIAISPDGRLVLTGSDQKIPVLWSRETGEEVRRFKGHPDVIRAIAFSPDGQYALTGGNASLVLWSIETGRAVRLFKGHTRWVMSLAYSPNGRYVVSGGGDGTVRLWSVETGMEVRRLQGGTTLTDFSSVDSLVFSPDGRHVLIGGGHRRASGRHIPKHGLETILQWSVETGQAEARFSGLSSRVSSMAFSPNDRYLLTGDQSYARLWSIDTGEELLILGGHIGWINSVAFSPDGKYVLTASSDDTVRLWDFETARELGRIVLFGDGTWAVIDAMGRFDAAKGGNIEGLHWVVGLEPVSLNQLKQRYYEPGLLAKLLGLNKEAPRDVSAFKDVALFPEVVLRTPSTKNPALGIKLTNRGGGIGRVHVAINGKEVTDDARGAHTVSNVKELQLMVPLASHPYIIPGEKNVIEVRAYEAEGYLSSRGVRVEYQPPVEAPLEKPILWAIVVGVSDYAGTDIDLRYPAKDAKAIGKALTLGAMRLFGAKKVQLILLTTDNLKSAPSKKRIKRAFEKIQSANPTDILFVYFAGHGVSRGDTYYYLTQNSWTTDLNDPAIREQTAISSEELVDWIKKSPALKQVMVLDTCAAGVAQRKLAENRSLSSDQIRAIERLKDRTGFHVLMGSAADAVSYEATRYEQGLLTYALLQGMRGPALRLKEYIDISQLFQYAADVVPTLAATIGGIQRPQIAAPKATSFDIGRLTLDDQRQIPLAESKPLLLPPAELQNADEGFDNLNMTSRVRKCLREASYAPLRGKSRELPVVYVDADQMSGAIRPSGNYRIEGSTITATLVLVKDGKKLSDLQFTDTCGECLSTSTELDTIASKITKQISRAAGKFK